MAPPSLLTDNVRLTASVQSRARLVRDLFPAPNNLHAQYAAKRFL
jgi:hypothetical protein